VQPDPLAPQAELDPRVSREARDHVVQMDQLDLRDRLAQQGCLDRRAKGRLAPLDFLEAWAPRAELELQDLLEVADHLEI